jgi:CheY-like chemotaxis protein
MKDILQFPSSDGAGAARTRDFVSTSIRYRRRASYLGRLADAEDEEAKMLPLVEQALSWIQLAENEEFLAQHDKRPVVLIVEDEALQRMQAAQILAAAGFDVLEAADAEHAIAWLERRKDIAVVFTDVRMPGAMDGLKLASEIRVRWPPIKIVATSQYVDVGADELPEGGLFVAKPYSPEQIVGTLNDLTGTEASSA